SPGIGQAGASEDSSPGDPPIYQGASSMPFRFPRLAGLGTRLCLVAFLAAVGFALLAAGNAENAPAAANPTAPAGDAQAQPANAQIPANHIVRQGFPAAKADANELSKSDTAWEIEWDLTNPDNQPVMPPGTVLRIRSAKFMWKNKNGQPQWITVARM